MSKPIRLINEDYEEFDKYVIGLIRVNWKEIWSSDLDLERRFSHLEQGQEQLLTMVGSLDANLRLYRDDSRHFMEKTEQANEKFRQEMRDDNEKFRLEIREDNEKLRLEVGEKFEKMDGRFEKMDGRFEKMDERFEKIDGRFNTINQQFIDVHKSINRMTVFFISGLGVIVLLAKLIDKIW
jgi:transcription antitermination factor NusG